MSFHGDPFICQCKKEDKKAQGFQISHCLLSFSSDLMAVKGLTSLFRSKRRCFGQNVVVGILVLVDKA